MRVQLPHPLILLLSCVAIAVALTWIIPAGEYQRREDPASGRMLVVPGTYARVEATPVGPMAALLAIPRGIIAGADVIVIILFVGGAFAMLEATGALARLVGLLVGRTRRPALTVVFISLGFAALGALENMHEEIIALIPVLLVLSRSLGFGAITALAMSLGSAVVGSAFGPTNPFQTASALKFAQLPPLSQPGLRVSLLIAAVALWIGWTLLMARNDDVKPEVAPPAREPARGRDFVLLALVLLPFVPYVYGVLKLDWGFNELSALFLVAALAIGVVSGKTLSDSAAAFLKSMEGLLAAGLFVGVARSISLVLTDGHVLDTILNGLATPLAQFPPMVAALVMVPIHTIIHVPVPSVSGHAALTMPVMAPLCDLLGMSRDVAVIAYQTGAGLSDMLVPSNGAMLAMLLGARVDFGRWLRFAIPGVLLVALVGIIGMALAR